MAQDFQELFTLQGFFTLLMLVLLQAVLGFDNLLYISLESKRAPKDQQSKVRKLGIGIAIGLRIVLLLVLLQLVKALNKPFWEFKFRDYIEFHFTFYSLITLFGGAFILYTATKEILHMMSLEESEHAEKNKKSAGFIIFWIVLMNLVFSFDSILSAMALTSNALIMGIAIVLSGIAMLWLADHVSNFLQKNRMYEVLGLFVLFVVGIMLLSEGGHLSHMKFFTHQVESMSKVTFYFVIGVLVLIDIVQGRYQKKLLRMKKKIMAAAHSKTPLDKMS